MRICIIGTGYVGLVTGTVFAEKGHEVFCVDNDHKKIEILKSGNIPIYEPGLLEMVERNVQADRLSFFTEISEGVKDATVIFIAVGTPPTETGDADLSFIEAVSRQIAEHLEDYKVIVEKSTVPVHTGMKVKATIEKNVKKDVEFDVASNPEFLREGSALEDALKPDRIVVGCQSERAEDVLKELYEPFDAPIIVTDIESAEIIKHASNSFLALKISYVNALANICELAGANIEDVTRGMGSDSRIGPKFLRAGIGFGGSCFPKDVDAFAKISKELGYDFPLLDEIRRVNKVQREVFVKKVEKELWVIKDKNIGVWGLSFKPNTDDMREAPSIDIINSIIKKGGNIKTYDPEAVEKAKEILPEEVKYCDDLYDVAEDVDCLLVVTEWDEFINADLQKVKELMKHPVIIDGRNIWDSKEMRELGFKYISIGRP